MTMIFTVMSWPKSPTEIELLLTSRTGDQSEWYRGPEFGLQLLMDAWNEFRRYVQPGQPWTDEATAAEFEQCHELFFGEKVWVDEHGYVVDEDTREPLQPKVKAGERYTGRLSGGSGSRDGLAYVQLKPDIDGFLERTNAIVKRFDVDPGDGHGEDCGYTLEVTDPRYAAHMRENRYWETAYVGHLPYHY